MRKSFLVFICLFMMLFMVGCTKKNKGNNQPIDDKPNEQEHQDDHQDDNKYSLKFYKDSELIVEYKLAEDEEIIFPAPPKVDGCFFAGWVEEDGFEFPLTIMPRGDLNLYATYLEGFTYRFVDYDDTLIYEGVGEKNSIIEVPNDPVRPKEGKKLYTFTGWDKEIGLLTEDVTYKATYSYQEVYTVTYHIDGGNWNYYSYDDIVKALLFDYNKYGGTSYTVSNVPTGAYEAINGHLFLLSGNNKAKWNWLIKYFSEHAALVNRPAFKALLKVNSASELNALDENYKYSISYELRAFLRGDQITSNMSYKTVNYQEYDLQIALWPYYNVEVEKTLVQYVPINDSRILLKKAYKQNYDFVGWHLNADLNDAVVSSYTLTDDTDFYVEFKQITMPTAIELTNTVNELEKLTTYQLRWNISPSDVKDKRVKFKSSNSSILTVSNSGLVTVLGEGKVTITVYSAIAPQTFTTFEVDAYSPNHFNVAYETSSIVKVGETIKLDAEYILRNGSKESPIITSTNDDIAVAVDNTITGVSKGYVEMILKASDENEMRVGVTVVDGTEDGIIKLLLDSHNSNILKVYNLGIGSGTPSYYMDIIGSVNKIIFNDPYEINNKYYATQQSISSNHGKEKTSTEFITVHYTGNMSATADGNANANYFATGGNGTSIHYVTGNDGIYYCLDEKYVGFHAGDGTGTTFSWIPTGVKVKENDPIKPVISINSESYFTVNGQATTVPVPTGSTELTKKVTDPKWINNMGIGYKVVDGEYYLATTWWCYTQVSEGRICNHGGNNNSIGIESCVNLGSDLWYTWQKTAQLVADLMDRYNLDITRVVGHHFYSAKNCPQPMLENNLQLWYEFIELVKAEYALRTEFSNYSIEMEVLSNSGALKATGRMVQPKVNDCVVYKLTITNNVTSQVETLTLSSLITGQLDK